MATSEDKGNVIELHRPVQGERLPTEEDVTLDAMLQESTQDRDSADMHRLGKTPQLRVSIREVTYENPRFC